MVKKIQILLMVEMITTTIQQIQNASTRGHGFLKSCFYLKFIKM